MPVKIFISKQDHFQRVAYLKNGEILDVDIEEHASKSVPSARLDQIYWGRVSRVESSHSFINLGDHGVGLLPQEPSFPKPIVGQAILVQVRREAIPDKGTEHKGPLLTCKITLGGRYSLLHPYQKKFLLSSKIQDPQLRNHFRTHFSPDAPITLREAAAHAPLEDVQAEISLLHQRVSEIEKLSNKAPCLTPYDALPMSQRWMRDLDPQEQNTILVDDDIILKEVRDFLIVHRPDLLPNVLKHHLTLFQDYGLEDFWDSLFQDVVPLPSGGNIVIDVTAAAVVIDVNQGDKDARQTNKEAIPVIIQHLKCRHLGGNIIIDFMGSETSPQDRDSLKSLLLKHADMAHLPLDIFGWSKLGWVETRLPKRRLPLGESVNLALPA
ncbi:MAG: ribonuclease E/G [Alphaproteobacteria bacterium]|jgi:ribonuclease G|nr:ribonuclease E/G [Alphaproteobacteria bacterium]